MRSTLRPGPNFRDHLYIEGVLRSHRDEPDETKIMGYTVISKIVPTSSEEKRRKRERLAWLLEQQSKKDHTA